MDHLTSMEREQYKTVIDRLVRSCLKGQGQIGAGRAMAGVWNRAADDPEHDMPDQRRMNALLATMSADDREVLAEMLAQAFESGVHETLKVLHEEEITPFEDGYEGTPFHDFVGRLNGWHWPDMGD